jgi:hypothetical protein
MIVVFIILDIFIVVSNSHFKLPIKMNRNDVLKIVDEHFHLFPGAAESLVAALNAHLLTLKNERLAQIEDSYIVQVLQRKVFHRVAFAAKINAAKTLILFLMNLFGNNINMSHLAHLHPMSRSSHFKTLVKHDLIKPIRKGQYIVSGKGKNILEMALRLKQATQRTQNNLPSEMPIYAIDAPPSVL